VATYFVARAAQLGACLIFAPKAASPVQNRNDVFTDFVAEGVAYFPSAVDAVSLADGAVTPNGLPDELRKAFHEILVFQQLA
jgi:hypothetical protein